MEHNIMEKCKIAVIGAGAAGLMAACTAAKTLKERNEGGRVLLLEGNAKAGRKLLTTGNGRCNLSNKNLSADFYHGDTKELPAFLREYGTAKMTGAFEEMGLLTVCGERGEGWIYPRSLQAAAVLKALLSACEENGVSCKYEFGVFSALPHSGGFLLKADNGESLFAEKCIVACGGKASPAHSGGKNGYDIAVQAGHTVSALSPSLTPLRCEDKMLRALKGVRCRAKVTLLAADKVLAADGGEVIFAENSLSGICVMNLSSYLADYDRLHKRAGDCREKIRLSLDLMQELSKEKLTVYLRRLCLQHPERPACELLCGTLPLKLGQELMKRVMMQSGGQKKAAYDPLMPLCALDQQTLSRVSRILKELVFTVTGTGSFEQAQVTAGGIPMNEISLQTMESKKRAGLYFAGEILDVNGRCGGYNLHFAFATGMAAGKSAASDIIFV